MTGNSASGGGGGIFNADFGGPAVVTLNHTQVGGNTPARLRAAWNDRGLHRLNTL